MPLFRKSFLIPTDPPSHHKSDLIKGAINTQVLIELLLAAMAEYTNRIEVKETVKTKTKESSKINISSKKEVVTYTVTPGPFREQGKIDLTPLNTLIHEKFSKVLLAQEKEIKKTAAEASSEALEKMPIVQDTTTEKASTQDNEKISYKPPVNMVQQFIDDARGSKTRNLKEKARHDARTKGIKAFQQVDQEFIKFFKLDSATLSPSTQTLLKSYQKLIKTINGIRETSINYSIIAKQGLTLTTEENGDFSFEKILNFSVSKELQDEIVDALLKNIPEILRANPTKNSISPPPKKKSNDAFVDRENNLEKFKEDMTKASNLEPYKALYKSVTTETAMFVLEKFINTYADNLIDFLFSDEEQLATKLTDYFNRLDLSHMAIEESDKPALVRAATFLFREALSKKTAAKKDFNQFLQQVVKRYMDQDPTSNADTAQLLLQDFIEKFPQEITTEGGTKIILYTENQIKEKLGKYVETTEFSNESVNPPAPISKDEMYPFRDVAIKLFVETTKLCNPKDSVKETRFSKSSGITQFQSRGTPTEIEKGEALFSLPPFAPQFNQQ